MATRAFLPSSVVAPPLAPPKRAVLEVPTVLGAGLKALAVAANPSNTSDCFMVQIIYLPRKWKELVRKRGGGIDGDGQWSCFR